MITREQVAELRKLWSERNDSNNSYQILKSYLNYQMIPILDTLEALMDSSDELGRKIRKLEAVAEAAKFAATYIQKDTGMSCAIFDRLDEALAALKC